MNCKYLIRLDDACPYWDKKAWKRIEEILDKHGIRPMIGVIPDCKDKELVQYGYDSHFWCKAKEWQSRGWAIALHGHSHCFISNKGLDGLNPMWRRSEFAGVSLEQQRRKIRDGINIMHEHGLYPKYFFSPAHTFDDDTLNALEMETEIRIISDTIARRPYRYRNFKMVPQIIGHCARIQIAGIYTFCFHPNVMSEEAFLSLDDFLNHYHKSFIGFDDIDYDSLYPKDVIDRLLTWAFFAYRRLRGLK